MILRRWGMLAACLLALGGCSPAVPGPASVSTASGASSAYEPAGANVSYSIWIVRRRQVILRFLVPAIEAGRAVGTEEGALLAHRFGSYLLAHVAVRIARDDCPAQPQGYGIGRVDSILAGEGLYGFEIFFHCPAAGSMTLEDDALFGRLADQVNFARIDLRSGTRQALFTDSRRQVTLTPGGATPSAGPIAYARLGAAHVLHSPELWCLLFGAAWLLARTPRLRWLSLAIAGGCLASLAVALWEWIAPRGDLLAAYGGFLIWLLPLQYIARAVSHHMRAAAGSAVAFGALAAVAWSIHHPMVALLLAGMGLVASGVLLAYAGRSDDSSLGVWAVFMAMFLDGFILPREIVPLQLPLAIRLPMLAGFDAGAALAAAALVALVLAVRRLISGPAASGDGLAGRAAALASDVAAAGLAVLGVFWLVSGSLAG